MQSIRAADLARLLPTLLAALVLAALPTSVSPQTIGTADWETLRPEGEEFEISMPRKSTAETSKDPYHKFTLTTRLYLSADPSGLVFAVSSMSGIKMNPALYSATERLNSYVDAFKHWFPKKIRGKDAVAKLALVGEKTLNGHRGRAYKISVADLSGTVHVYATRRRFYAVASLSNKKDDEVQQKQFLSSFVLPERVADAPPTVAAQKRSEEAEPSGDVQGQKPEAKAGSEGTTDTPTDAKAREPAPPTGQPTPRAPISGGVLNGKAITLPRPDYPAEARAARASGTVVVQVTIDEYGNVSAARAISGHPLLQQPSVNAAMQAKFSPTFLMGEPVKVTGVITYNFVVQ